MNPLLLLLVCAASANYSPLRKLLLSSSTNYEALPLNKTHGAPPAWLKGTLYRTGPGLWEHGVRSVNNVVDGLAKVHAWHFPGDGSVTYTGKMLTSNVYNKTMKDGIFAPYPVMGDVVPPFSWEETLEFMKGGVSYADNTNIAPWNLDKSKTVTVCGESPQMHQVSRSTLDYLRPFPSPVLAKLSWRMPMFSASHYSPHPTDGSSFNYVLSLGIMMDPKYDFYQYTSSDDGEVEVREIGSIPITMANVRIMHAFGVTENFLVVPRWNYEFIMNSAACLTHSNMCECMNFAYDKPMFVDIISIASGKPHHTFSLPPAQGVHIMNTYERTNAKGEQEVVMDYPTMTDPHAHDLNSHCMFDVLKIPILNDPEKMYAEYPWDTTLRRFVFNLDTGNYTITDLPRIWEPLDALVEFPYINPDYRGKEYCYAYLQNWQFKEMSMSLVKYDVCQEKVVEWGEDHKHVMEPVYAPRPDSVREDDGVIVAPVFDSVDGTTELYVWNATDLMVLARYDNKVDVPITIHGLWFDA